MNLLNRLFVEVLCLFFLVSCNAFVEDDFPDFIKVPVLNAVLEADSTFCIQVSFTANLTDSVPLPVEDAMVIIVSDTVTPDTLVSIGAGNYESLRIVQSGKTYTCKVIIDGYPELTAQTHVPETTLIDHVVFQEFAGIGEEGDLISKIKFSIQNNPEKRLFWEVKLAEKGIFKEFDFEKSVWIEFDGFRYQYIFMIPDQDAVLLHEAAPLTVFSNSEINTERYDTQVYFSENNFTISSNRDYYIEVRCIDESFYKFQKQFYLYETANWNELGNSPQTYPLYTNVKNGLGIFTSFSVSRKQIEF